MDRFFAILDGKETGPFEIRALFRLRGFGAATPVRYEKDPKWRPAGDVPTITFHMDAPLWLRRRSPSAAPVQPNLQPFLGR